MTKTFRGTPGDPPKVTVEENGLVRMLASLAAPDLVRPFAWGDGSIGATDLAMALIVDVLGDKNEGIRLKMRLKHRLNIPRPGDPFWRAGEPWEMTDGQLSALIEDIRRVERDTAQSRAMAAREPTPIVDGSPPRSLP
jgi:hypothetical protein